MSFDEYSHHAEAPPAPWHLRGEAMVMLIAPRVSTQGWRKYLPRALALVNYGSSPVGSYCERAIIEYSARGPIVTEMQVDSASSMRGGRENWGFPKTLETLSWKTSSTQRIEFHRAATGETHRARVLRFSVPFQLRAFTVQKKAEKWVRVPVKVQSEMRPAWCGKRLALHLCFAMVVDAAQEI